MLPTWQDSQPSAAMSMCLAGTVTMARLALLLKMPALAALWHCAQLTLMDGALAWILEIVGKAVKSPWQAEQVAAAAYGMWLAGRDGAPKSVNPPWQLEQSPLAGCGTSLTK